MKQAGCDMRLLESVLRHNPELAEKLRQAAKDVAAGFEDVGAKVRAVVFGDEEKGG